MFKRTNGSPPKVNFTDGVKTPREIYAAYKIMSGLQLHQLRVAAVGKLICDNFDKPINERDVILACLFHDMGNTIKFEPKLMPDVYQPEGVEYWLGVKAEYIKKYGNNPHNANVAIAKELGLSERVVEMMDAVGFSRLKNVVQSLSVELKVLQYADMRVAPLGIRSMEERITEGRTRYEARVPENRVRHFTDDGFSELLEAARRLEQQIFAETMIKPEDINDATVAPLIETLRDYPID